MDSPFLQLLQNEGAQVVDLCAGRIKDGREFHAFVQMDIESYKNYQTALRQRKPVDLNAYGKILHTGWGKEPDAATSARIMKDCTQNKKIFQAMEQHTAAMVDILHKNAKGSDAR